MKTSLLAALAILTLSITASSQVIKSDFSAGIDGWTCEGDASPTPTFVSSGGNPGGYIQNTDFSNGITWYWVAPSKFLGNQASKYGKTLKYDLKQSTTSGAFVGDDITIEGNGRRLKFRAGHAPLTTWTSFTVSLIETAGWYLDTTGNPTPTKVQMQSVLSNITKIRIRAEYSTSVDSDGLDNVILGGSRYYAGAANAGFFDGTNSYISLGSSSLLKPATQVTVQCWGLFNNEKRSFSLVSNTQSGGYNISYDVADSMIHFYVRVNGNYISAVAKRPAINTWHHYALTYDGRLLKGYIDGTLQQSVDAGGSFPITYYASNSTLVGAEAGSGDSPDGNYLNGYVDELSFWNKALTQAQIRAWMCSKIKPEHPAYSSLLAYYKFDQEKSDSKLFDQRLTTPGTLRSGAFFTLSGAPIGDTSSNVYGNLAVFLKHPDGDSVNVQVTSGNPAGLHIYRVDQKPSIVKGTKGLGPNDRYFGVFLVNDTTAKYKVVYGYKGNPYVTTSAEPGLKLYRRNNNADSLWKGVNATLNTTTKTLTATGQKTEYIIGSTDTALQKKSVVSVDDITITEGNSSFKQAKFILRLNAAMNGTSYVNFKTQDSTAKSANNDYQSTNGTAKFEPGTLTDTVQVRVDGDVNVEPNEFFKLLLNNSINITYSDSIATCKITNDDIANMASSRNPGLKIVVPTVLRHNQVWYIRGIEGLKANVILVDGTGKKVFEQDIYQNNAVLRNLNAGIYFYRLMIRDKYDKVQEYAGKIMIVE